MVAKKRIVYLYEGQFDNSSNVSWLKTVRRCWWKCNADNVASSNCALRLGMQLDGISKYGRSIEKHKDGVELPETDLHCEVDPILLLLRA